MGVVGESVGDGDDDDKEDASTLVVVWLVVVTPLVLAVVEIAIEGADGSVEVPGIEVSRLIVVEITVVEDWTVDLLKYQNHDYLKPNSRCNGAHIFPLT